MKLEVEMDDELVGWIDECVKKGTFTSRGKALDFLTAMMRDLAIEAGISQETNSMLKCSVPLDWEKLKKTYTPPKFGAKKAALLGGAVKEHQQA